MMKHRPKVADTNRRDFLRQLTLGCGSILIIPACTSWYPTSSTWRFFSDQEAKTIIAFTEQIIPADQDPGATYANVINFMDKQLTGPHKRFQDNYRKGIPAIDNSAKELFHKAFHELDSKEQITFMELMESGKLPEEFWKEINQIFFFNLVLDHSMQGFYGSPRHGGNKNYVSYKMIRLDYPQVLGQNRYESKL